MPVSFTWSNVDYVSAVLFMLVCSVVFKNEGFGYISIVQEVADKALAHARGEVAIFSTSYLLSLCGDMKGNSFFSFVVFHMVTCNVFCSNKKIIAVSSWSRADERSAPRREVPHDERCAY